MINLIITKRTDSRLIERMLTHYSKPKGFVGRNICYAVMCNGLYFGHIVGGSATLHLPGRNEFLNITKSNLNSVINNIFFNVSIPKELDKYPCRNFTSEVVKTWRDRIVSDWKNKYEDEVIGFETLVEKPRTGDLYIKDGWTLVGETKGYSCKRTSGNGTDGWSGKRVWDTDKDKLKPKLVLCKRI